MLASVTDYKQLSDIEHVLDRPDMYVGTYTIQQRTDAVAITTDEGVRLQYCTFNTSDAVERFFLEILSNATDNVIRSRQGGMDESQVGGIDVRMNETTIAVRNYGIPITLDIHPVYNMRLPKLIFTQLRTGSNYGDNVSGAGKFGLGAKLTAIHSTMFKVTVASGYQGMFYSQTWHNNLSHEDPEILQPYSGPSYVEIEYMLDFQRIGYMNNSYTDTDLALIHRHTIDASLTSKIVTSFNGLNYNMSNMADYVKLLCNTDKESRCVIHVEPQQPVQDINAYRKGYWKHVNNLPMIELCIVETIDNPAILAYTNGIPNRYGGVHVNEAIESTSNILITKVNSMFEKINNKGVLNKADLKKHITCIIAIRVRNPIFDSQSKTALKEPKIKIKFDDEEQKKFEKFNLLFKRLLSEVEGKAMKAFGKTGKKTRHIDVEECEDANYAGTNKSVNCVLMLTEGKSAKGYATEALQHVPGRRDYFGSMPLRGKPLNVKNADIVTIVKNQVLLNLKEALGLREGVDYTIDANYKTLRYGKILIMADADEDGKHIIGLIFNIFNEMYKSLIVREYIMILRTPIIRVKKGKQMLSFRSFNQYKEWSNITPDFTSWTHKYLKGLASSNKEEIVDDFKDPKYVQIVYDDQTESYMDLAFNEKRADDRKEWLKYLGEALNVETWDRLPISYFIGQEFIGFMRDNLGRNIPRLMDGLKESQRKIMWGCYTYKGWGTCGRYENGRARIGKSDLSNNAKSIKVGTLASHVQEQTSYKHGDQCLASTIIGMASDYVGSNNISYFFQDGLFGSRNDLGEDAGNPRYIFTKPAKIIPYIYRIEDFPLMKFEVDEGEDQEPVQFHSVIPMIAVNGANGIGSAYSTTVPKFNPLDIIMWYKIKCLTFIDPNYKDCNNIPEPMPWYRGFKGTITAHESKIKGDEEEDVEYEDEMGNMITVKMTIGSGMKYKFRGNYHVEGRDVVITELPVGMSTSSYRKFLEGLVKDKKLIDSHDGSTPESVYFRLFGYTGELSDAALRMVKTVSTANMILLDENDVPHRYKRITDILEAFYNQRIVIYRMRKQHLIDEQLKIIPELQEKLRFITDIVEGHITVFRRTKDNIVQQLLQRNFDKDIYKGISLAGCSQEDIDNLQAKINEHINIYNGLEALQAEAMWYKDLDELEKAYKQQYKL